MAPKESKPTITEETRIPLKAAWFLMTLAVSGTILLYGIYNRLGTIESAVREGWTLDNQRLWAAQMKAGNPTINVPDADAIKGRK